MTAVVIGGGISGIACATTLAAAGIDVEVRERSRALGGRMATPTLRGTGTRFDGRLVDVGASYFTVSDPDFREAVDRLVTAGVARPWTDAFHVAGPDGIEGASGGPMRYAAAAGLRSVVAGLADPLVRDRVLLRSEVSQIALGGSGVVVDGAEVASAALCMPLPQASRISGDLPVETVHWEPVIAVTCVFDRRSWIEMDGVFVNDDPVLTWIADDGSRRGDGAPVLVAHVHPVLSARHLDDPASVVPAAIAAVQRVLGLTVLPDWVDAHRWTLAKPLEGRVEGHWIHEDAPLGVAGDAWAGGPRVEAAWLSGRSLGRALAARMT
jgi:renalase